MTNEISADELRPGDWLLFQGDPDSFLSKAIMKLTNSDVSHAALYIGGGQVAEEISPGLVTTDIEERLGRRSYVMRRSEPHPDLERVVGVAHDYLAEGEKYAFGTLVLVGLILVYRQVSISPWMRRVVTRILKAASLEVFGLLEKFRYEGKTPMVCSQFVYECYARPAAENPAYRLDLEQPLLEAAAVPGGLIDELRLYPAPESLPSAAELEAAAAEDPEELARELLEAMEAMEAEAQPETVGVDAELYAAARRFCDLAAPLLGPVEEATDALEAMADHRSYFVAPADLLRVRNGRRVGVIPPQPPATDA